MKNKFLLIAFFVFFTPSIGFSLERSEQELILADNPIYDMATAIFLESGLWNFSDSFPLTKQEMKIHLEEVDYEKLSAQGKKYFDEIFKWFSESDYSIGSNLLSLGIEPAINLEGYYKTSENVDWVFDRYDRKPLLDLPLKISLAKYATVYCDIYASQNRSTMEHHDTYVNIPLGADQFDLNFPTTAYFSTGTKIGEHNGISFQIGMAERATGRTLSGSIIQSEFMTGATTGQLLIYGHNVRFSSAVTQLNRDRYFYSHKLEFRLFKKFTFSAVEGAVIAAPLELRFLNPLPIFHGFSAWRDYDGEEGMHSSSFLGVKAVFVPVKYLRIYGMFAMTQLQTPYEKQNWPDSLIPNGMGGQGGVESYIPLWEGYLHSGLEFYYAEPYLYLKPSPNSVMVRTYQENIGDMKNFYEWIGSPFGPDTIAVTAKIGYEKPKMWSASLKYLFLMQGELSDRKIFGSWGTSNLSLGEEGFVWDGFPSNANGRNGVAERDRVTPSGIPQINNIISIHASYFPLSWIEIIMQPSFAFVLNNNHISDKSDFSFEIAVGCRVKLNKFR